MLSLYGLPKSIVAIIIQEICGECMVDSYEDACMCDFGKINRYLMLIFSHRIIDDRNVTNYLYSLPLYLLIVLTEYSYCNCTGVNTIFFTITWCVQWILKLVFIFSLCPY